MIPKQREIIDNNKINNKKNIKVLILGTPDEGVGLRFNIEIWNIVKSKLEKDGYKITETVIKDPNYTKDNPQRREDMLSKFYNAFNKNNGYLYSKEEVLEDLKIFIKNYKLSRE